MANNHLQHNPRQSHLYLLPCYSSRRVRAIVVRLMLV